MDAPGFRPFRVWLGFIAAAVAVLLIVIVPGPPLEERVNFYYDESHRQMVAVPVEDVSEMHPMMPFSAACLALGWWFFWLYRRHQQLAQVTNSTYPVRPGQAVGFHFVPGFNLYWVFHWTRRFTHFCDLVQSGLIKQPASPPGPGSAGKPPAIFAGDMSGASDLIKPGWLPGVFMWLAMLVAYGAFVPRNLMLREFRVRLPGGMGDFLWSLVIALAVATFLDRRLLSAVASDTPSSSSPKSTSTLGI